MKTQEKSVPVYVYFMAIERHKDGKEADTKYEMSEIISAFSNMLSFTVKQDLKERKQDNTSIEKVIWLDSFQDLKDGNYNLVFKSAKYNHVRDEINTVTMESLGRRKNQQDGEEERTHLCIRLAKGQFRFLAIHESNHYGISIKSIVDYLNGQFEKVNEQTEQQEEPAQSEDKYFYQINYEIVPSDSFLNQLKKAKSLSLVRLEVDKGVLKDDFLQLSGRDGIKDTVEIAIRRPRGVKSFPENLIKAYYENMQSDNRIKSITVSGRGASKNSMEFSTDLIKMKHCISVACEEITYEVQSSDFFNKAQSFINDMLR